MLKCIDNGRAGKVGNGAICMCGIRRAGRARVVTTHAQGVGLRAGFVAPNIPPRHACTLVGRSTSAQLPDNAGMGYWHALHSRS